MLSVGILSVVVMVLLTASAKRTVALGAMLLLIPFQLVETRFGSSSVLIAYGMAGAMLLLGGMKVRMLPAIGFVLLAYLLSLTQAERFLMLHVVEIFQFFSCFLVFLLAYNYAQLVKSERTVIDLLLWVNLLVIAYCILQISAGAGEAFKPFGIDALAFNKNRDPTDPRLIGPFDNPGTTAGYLALMTMLCLTELLFAQSNRRRLIQVLILANVACIVATGNRASFLVLLASYPALLIGLRAELGTRRFVQFMSGGIIVVFVATAGMAALTGFGNILRRLETVTQTEDGMPMTRADTWPLAIEKIKRNPWLGEGPHFFRAEDAETMGIMPSRFEELGDVVRTFDPYPHSLYLFLLRTVGIVGLIAVLWFFVQVALELRKSLRRTDLNARGMAFAKSGIVVIGAFLVTQVTLEFNRTATIDFAQFILALMGLLLGMADRGEPVRSIASVKSHAVADASRP